MRALVDAASMSDRLFKKLLYIGLSKLYFPVSKSSSISIDSKANVNKIQLPIYRQFSELQPRPFGSTSWRNFHSKLIEIRYLIWATLLYPFVLPHQNFTMQIDFLQSPVPSCTRVLMGQSIWLVMFQPLYSTARNYTHVDSRNFFTAGPCRECVNIWESGHVVTGGRYGENPPLFSSRHQNPWTRFPRRTSGSVNFRKQGRARAPNNNL